MSRKISKIEDLHFCYNDIIDQYENLRSCVLRNSDFYSNPNMGYVLFLRQGMSVWMENCNTYALDPEVFENPQNNSHIEFPDYFRKQLVFALTNIVINQQRRV